jgi:hypothetical protein
LYHGDTESDQAQLMGLLNTKNLTYDKNKLGDKEKKLVSSWCQVAPKLDSPKPFNPPPSMVYSDSGLGLPKSTLRGL